MSVLSLYFLLFLLLLAGIYYAMPVKSKPYILLMGNVLFYLTFPWYYFIFLLFSICTFWMGGIMIEDLKYPKRKKWMAAIIFLNTTVLFSVKYLPYLLQRIISHPETEASWSFLAPIGISFYTLQLIGYLVDIYRGKIRAQRNFFRFSLFAGFFPLILQGPVSRYDQLAPQLYAPACKDWYSNITYGAQLMLWGYFKKLVIADRLAIAVNAFYTDYTAFGGAETVLAVICYSFQIYSDFSGCVDICRGAGQLFGIHIIENFDHPYFSVSLQDFWKRWHQSLSSWFRDYIYIPLGGSRKGNSRKYLNLLLVFLISGIWHGVGLHFIVWGLLHAVLQIIGAVLLPARKKFCHLFHINKGNRPYRIFRQLITFTLITFTWIFFRAADTASAMHIITRIFTAWDVSFQPKLFLFDNKDWAVLVLAVSILLAVSLLQNKGIELRKKIASLPLPLRWFIYLSGFLCVLIFGIYGPGYSESAFIYMNF